MLAYPANMILSLMLASAQPAEQPVEPPAQSPAQPTAEAAAEVPPDCSYDLQVMLKLDRQAFDQDIPDGGWRALSRKGCHSEAAELIREWRHEKRDHNSILYWHEGQMRAFAGQSKAAIALFELTRKSQYEDADFGWNHYVDGSIAFLRQNRDGLARAMAELAKVPEPESNSFTRPDGTVVQMSWPPNLNVLKAFERCWGKSYADAYGTRECMAPDQAE